MYYLRDDLMGQQSNNYILHKDLIPPGLSFSFPNFSLESNLLHIGHSLNKYEKAGLFLLFKTSLCKHPQLLVFPLVRVSFEISFIFPHLHLHA